MGARRSRSWPRPCRSAARLHRLCSTSMHMHTRTLTEAPASAQNFIRGWKQSSFSTLVALTLPQTCSRSALFHPESHLNTYWHRTNPLPLPHHLPPPIPWVSDPIPSWPCSCWDQLVTILFSSPLHPLGPPYLCSESPLINPVPDFCLWGKAQGRRDRERRGKRRCWPALVSPPCVSEAFHAERITLLTPTARGSCALRHTVVWTDV